MKKYFRASSTEETFGMTGLEGCKRNQHVAYLLLPLLRARSFLTEHPNEFKARKMQVAAV
jgi:hypothetical protein